MHEGPRLVQELLDFLDGEGIDAQVLYPNVAGFGSQRFLSIPDDDLKDLKTVQDAVDYVAKAALMAPYLSAIDE